MRRTRGRLTFITLVLTRWSITAHAQTAQINGTVLDASSAVVPGATLTIRNIDTNDTRAAVSNGRGRYNVPFLPSGRYTVNARSRVFKRLSAKAPGC